MTNDTKSLLDIARRTGVVVTAFPTRDVRWRARLNADDYCVYTDESDSLADLFTKLGEEMRDDQ